MTSRIRTACLDETPGMRTVHIGSVGIALPGSAGTTEVIRGEPGTQQGIPTYQGFWSNFRSLPHHDDAGDRSGPPGEGCGRIPPGESRPSLRSRNPVFPYPCGIMTLLNEYQVTTEGMHAVVMGRSIEVGRPMAALLLSANATVTITHSKTRNLPHITREADLLVVAIGKPRYVGPSLVKEGSVVIDVGTNRIDGVLCGDVDFDRVKDHTSAITPVPGGVGPMTIASLMENTFLAAQRSLCTDAW